MEVDLTSPIMESITVYAHWSPKKYTVRFDGNGGSGFTESITYNCMVGELPESSREGYEFNGWYTAKEGGIQVETSTVITDNVVFYAHWKQESVKFDPKGGFCSETELLKEMGVPIGYLPVPR